MSDVSKLPMKQKIDKKSGKIITKMVKKLFLPNV